jgi:hypothetical protein
MSVSYLCIPRNETVISKQNYNVLFPRSVRDLYISRIDLSILLQKICGPILGTYISLTEIGTEAAQFPEEDYIRKWDFWWSAVYENYSCVQVERPTAVWNNENAAIFGRRQIRTEPDLKRRISCHGRSSLTRNKMRTTLHVFSSNFHSWKKSSNCKYWVEHWP